MNVMTKRLSIAATLISGLLLVGAASAATVVMTFDQLNPNGELIDNYYNGGCGDSYAGGSVTCNGPSDGVVWVNAIAGGAPNGLFNNVNLEPSMPGVLGGFTQSPAYMNVAAGFDTGFSFYYAAAQTAASINVYSGLNGTGSVLATLDLPVNGANCNGASESYSCWSPIGVAFNGTAESVAFGGNAFYVAYDNVTLGSATPIHPVPEPAALGLFGLGTLLIGAFVALRRRFA